VQKPWQGNFKHAGSNQYKSQYLGEIGLTPHKLGRTLSTQKNLKPDGLITPQTLDVVTKYYDEKEFKRMKKAYTYRKKTRKKNRRINRSQSTYTRRYEYRREPDTFVRSLNDLVDKRLARARA
jgi:hypothetical protein